MFNEVGYVKKFELYSGLHKGQQTFGSVIYVGPFKFMHRTLHLTTNFSKRAVGQSTPTLKFQVALAIGLNKISRGFSPNPSEN